jgi:hypothetical protein
MDRPLSAPVSVGLALLVVALLLSNEWWLGRRRWWRFADLEQVEGLVVLLLTSVVVALAWLMIFLGEIHPAPRALGALGAIVLAVFVVSTQWTARSTRRLGYVGLILVALVVIDIGRGESDALARTGAALDDASSALAAFDGTLPEPQAAPAEVTDPPPWKSAIEEAQCVLMEIENPQGESYSAEVECDPSLPADLLVALETARIELGRFRESFAKDTDEELKELLAGAIAEIQAAAEQLRPEHESLVDTLRQGGDTIVADLPWRHDPSLSLDAFGWVLLGMGALIFWRMIERRSAQQLPGPVTLKLSGAKPPEEDEKGEQVKGSTETAEPGKGGEGSVSSPTAPPSTGGTAEKKEADEAAGESDGAKETSASMPDDQMIVFRTAVLQNLSEPAAIPGSKDPDPVTDLVELAGGVGKPALKLLTSLGKILTRPGGYSVTGEVIAPDEPKGTWRVLARIVDQSSADQVAVKTVSGETARRACRGAGYWAAAEILSRSTRIPSWARWNPVNASTLAAYQDEDDLETLEDALQSDPTSGILLNRVGNEYELVERHLDALVMYARAVTAHPRYLVGCYRLAVSLGVIAADVETQWEAAALSTRERVRLQLNRACARLRIEDTAPRATTSGDDAAATFQRLSLRVFNRLLDDTGRGRVPWLALRRSERKARWSQLMSVTRRYGPAAKDRWMVRSARLSADPTDLPAVQKRASNPQSWWQVSYNLACYYARQDPAQPDDAIKWLETALERAGSGQMGGAWLKKDPDLKSLHGLPRFQWVASQLPQQEEDSDG